MKTHRWLTLGCLLLAAAAVRADEDPEARRIMERVDARDDGDTWVSTLEMVLIAADGPERRRRLRAFRRDVGDDQHQVLFFEAPAQVKDTAFLTYDYHEAGRDDDQWLYLPALHKVKRIAGADQSGSFMGSDFSYADLTRHELEAYDYKLLREEEVRGHPVWLIEAVPRSEDEIERTGYTRSILFVRQDCYVAVRAVHWVGRGGRLKYLDVTRLEEVGGIWTSLDMEMTVKEGGRTLHRTLLRNLDVRYNEPLEERLFTVRALEHGPR